MQQHGRKQYDLSQLQHEKYARAAYATQLVEKWSKHEAGVKLDETFAKKPGAAKTAAMALENQNKYLNTLTETTISSQFSTTPENVLRIVRIGTANSNRGNIFTEWPMVTTDDAIYFIEKTRSKSLRGATAGEILHEQSRPYYAGEAQPEETVTEVPNGAITTFTITLSVQPVVPYSVRVYVDDALAGNDDGAGGFVGALLDTTASTINYATGAVSLEFLVAPVTGTTITLDFHFDSEVAANFTNYGEVELSVRRKRFNARPMPLGYSYTKMVELTLGTSGLGNVEDMLVKAVGDEHAKRRDERAIKLAKQVAKGNAITTFSADFAGAGEDNDINHAQRITSTISDMSGTLYNDIQRGSLNKAVAGSQALTYLKKHKLWQTDNTQARVGSTFLAGTLDDIEVYGSVADSAQGLLDTNEVLLTYKNVDDDGDVGLAFGTLTELIANLDYPQFYREGNIATVEDSLVINSKFCRLLQITGL